ncbi:cell division protein FtsI (penicillin-binding protein 3) [Flavobacterium aciduliphilum]|uniref:Cell division protein FtsI (Penicillin-binding protein 3) n=2 Tax=Flavobacterium aciduliphilum TaxID=1101402 RepID=A0A328YIG0_9FLAO|nr:cell division protein FtsI (penicillin-binding protein 3) [Flavobacterium aciduliphilum]
MYRLYLVSILILIFALAIVYKLTTIQWKEGEHYRKLAKIRTVKTFVVPANRGNIYSSDGSLLATSVSIYDVRFDALAPNEKIFNENIGPLSDSLAKLLGHPSGYYETKLVNARKNKNRFLLLAKDLSFTQYKKLKSYPILKLGIYKGGRIDSVREIRKHPIGEIAQRTVGYLGFDKNGMPNIVGLEGAYNHYLSGKNGKILKQKIAKGQYKPIRDDNEIDPIDGSDIISTIDVYIQDIAHHSLLESLQKNKAEHGCVIVMETQTGYIKAISNLGRTEKDSVYKERLNYAIREKGEPGSTFKLIDMIALLEDHKVDTTKIYNRKGGRITLFGRDVVDSHSEGPQLITLANGFEISSNTVMVQAVYENYKNNPMQFVDRINKMGLNKPLGLSIKGEANPFIPQPGTPRWNGMSLPWMAFGYGIEVTPMQTLTLYNAIANNGEMVKPQFVSEIKEWNTTIKKFDKQVIHPKICSKETIKKLKAIMQNVVKLGTAKKIYSKDFSMAGKTGTAQGNYGINNGDNKHYISSFVGFFPVDKPKYTCIVVIHKPNTASGSFYGADVAAPVFKRIAQKIFTDSPTTNEIQNLNQKVNKQEYSYNRYFTVAQSEKYEVPNVKGMPAMDAVPLLENLGMKVRLRGNGVGKVKHQSIVSGTPLKKGTIIELQIN